MSRRLFIANVVVGALGCLLAAGVIRDVSTGRSLPPAPVPRGGPSTLQVAPVDGPPPPISAYQVIATKNLFSPGRLDAAGTTAATAMAPGVRPILHGVVLDGDRSRAYLEEPPVRQVFGYGIGDRIAGGRLDSIGLDRVVIVRPDGPLEVLLHDTSKPRPAANLSSGPEGQQVRTQSSRRLGGGVAPPPPPPPPPPQPPRE